VPLSNLVDPESERSKKGPMRGKLEIVVSQMGPLLRVGPVVWNSSVSHPFPWTNRAPLYAFVPGWQEEEEDGKVAFEFRHGSESEEAVWFVG
jgi:hypothetical protein